VRICAINFDPDSTPIDSNISFLVVSHLSCFYIQRETDYKTTFLANFATTTPLRKIQIFFVYFMFQNNAPRILSAILAFISDSTFMNQLYPEITSKDEIQQKLDRNRQNYLYMPQYGPKQTMHARGDTPLHIATRKWA
jgi:hypothetical protein